jgi:hypothetical protein
MPPAGLRDLRAHQVARLAKRPGFGVNRRKLAVQVPALARWLQNVGIVHQRVDTILERRVDRHPGPQQLQAPVCACLPALRKLRGARHQGVEVWTQFSDVQHHGLLIVGVGCDCAHVVEHAL